MKRSTEEFKEEILSLIASFGKEPDPREATEEHGLTVKGGRCFVLERNWFNRSWPRWLASIVANCPHKEALACCFNTRIAMKNRRGSITLFERA